VRRWPVWIPAITLLFAGCGRYADFRLPPVASSNLVNGYELEMDPRPVIPRAAAGAFDSADVLNPSVVRHGGLLYNFYSGFDGHVWRTGLATSQDGRNWTRLGAILSPDARTWEGNYIAANGSAVFYGGEFLYWYQAGPKDSPRLGLARSRDGRNWRKLSQPVLDLGPRGSWDERGVGDPYVIRVKDSFYLFYLGQDRARRQRLGVARSTNGEQWEKLRSNPILEPGEAGAFDEVGLGEPAVWIAGGAYWMLYTGRNQEENRRLGLAQSSDGVHWRKRHEVFAGRQDWNSKVLCDPTIEALGNSLAVWFGGGNLPRPDENLNGQIGIGILNPH